jgi:hypothetical protein
MDRRDFLGAGAAAVAATYAGAQNPAPAVEPTSFFVVGDTHYLADQEHPAMMTENSAGINSRLVDTLNRLPGTMIPTESGGGSVRAPRGVIHVGDLIDTGDKTGATHVRMQETELAAYVADFGLTGRDGRLRYPVYEVHGNHDAPGGEGAVISAIRTRNRTRPGLANVSANGLHCSWDWGGIHFVCLGIVVGSMPEPNRRRRYAPLDSYRFLVDDLDRNVGRTDKPLFIVHHVDVLRYSGPCNPRATTNAEWDPCDVHGYYEVLRNRRVLGVMYGHTHSRRIFRWDGTPREARTGGIPTFNNDKSGHYAFRTHALLHFDVGRREMLVREFGTADGWRTGRWTPNVWRYPIE